MWLYYHYGNFNCKNTSETILLLYKYYITLLLNCIYIYHINYKISKKLKVIITQHKIFMQYVQKFNTDKLL